MNRHITEKKLGKIFGGKVRIGVPPAIKPITWSHIGPHTPAPKSMQSPFNMEAILCADMELLKLWKQRPFIFALKAGKLIVRYINVRDL